MRPGWWVEGLRRSRASSQQTGLGGLPQVDQPVEPAHQHLHLLLARPGLRGRLERLRAFNRWTKGWAASIAVAVGIWIVLRSYLIEAFRIPSASMENTLLVGDFLFVNKAIYGGELEIPLTGIRCCRLPGYAEPQ